MKKYFGYAHISDYKDTFGPEVGRYMSAMAGPGRELEFHYSQSIQLDGRALFSVLIIVYETTAS